VSPLPPLEDDLALLSRDRRLRACSTLDGVSRLHATQAGHAIITFCSNDYLGLASHPALAQAAATAAERYGFGAGASRLVSGELAPHRELERSLAALVNCPAALLFSTGFQANLGLVTSLAGPADLIVSDEANHASLIDGARLSRAKIEIYGHLDPDAARAALQTPGRFRRRLLLTESLFSMDGDRAPLRALADLAREYEATLIVDEAHALGALGPAGRGLCFQEGVTPDVLVGTLGKAFGAFGGFVAGSQTLCSYLVNRARSFIYTTALPPPVAAAALAGVSIAMSSEGDARRARLAVNVLRLRTALAPALTPLESEGPIFPVRLGADDRALQVSRRLLDRGLFIPAIRPPTVPEGTARLRVTLSADHTPAEVDLISQALVEAVR
jgi:8-amino-7-oxononanoate synthase